MKFQFRVMMMSCALALTGLQGLSAADVQVFGGYTVGKMRPDNDVNGSTMNGWNTSVTAYATSRLGLTADVAGLYGNAHTDTSSPVSIRQYSFMAGPQFRLLHTERFETSVRALFGGAYGYVPGPDSGTLNQSTFASLIGSNFDLKVSKRVAMRFSPGLYLTQYGEGHTQKNFRFSAGPVFQFGGRGE